MDKYERRRLAANDRRLGKMHDERAAYFRKDAHVRDKRFVYETLCKYIPCVGRFVSLLRTPESYGPMRVVNVGGQRVTVWLEEFAHFLRPRVTWRRPEPVLMYLDARGFEYEEPWEFASRRIWAGPLGTDDQMVEFYYAREVDYVYDHFHQRIDVDKSLKKLQHALDAEFVQDHAPSFFRTTERTSLIRDELAVVSRKWRAIHNCKVIKEELMAAVWHPRRVEHILDNYGWDAYNNLIGE
jgi:hypothetical protein